MARSPRPRAAIESVGSMFEHEVSVRDAARRDDHDTGDPKVLASLPKKNQNPE